MNSLMTIWNRLKIRCSWWLILTRPKKKRRNYGSQFKKTKGNYSSKTRLQMQKQWMRSRRSFFSGLLKLTSESMQSTRMQTWLRKLRTCTAESKPLIMTRPGKKQPFRKRSKNIWAHLTWMILAEMDCRFRITRNRSCSKRTRMVNRRQVPPLPDLYLSTHTPSIEFNLKPRYSVLTNRVNLTPLNTFKPKYRSAGKDPSAIALHSPNQRSIKSLLSP